MHIFNLLKFLLYCCPEKEAENDDKKIAGCASYEKHLNQYNVINLDITWFISIAQRKGIALREVPDQIADAVKEDILALDPSLSADKGLEENLIAYVDPTGKRPRQLNH